LRKKSSMRDHGQKQHPKHPPKWTPCSVQQFNSGSASRLFEVIPPPPLPAIGFTERDIIDELLHRVQGEGDGADPEPTDARLVSPWLNRTGWHLHTKGHDVAQLRALAATPLKEEFPGLGDAVKAYLESTIADLGWLDTLVLQHLNSADPAKK
jgi:hypothetical protein